MIEIDKLKPFVNKLINNYDSSYIYDDKIVFDDVELNYTDKNKIGFILCNRIEVYQKNENTFVFEIYKNKDSQPVIIDIF